MEVNMTGKQSMISPDFPKKLKQLRQGKEWSQGQVAMKIGVDMQRISKYERGVLHPTTELALKLAIIFEVSLDYMLRNEEDMTNSRIKNPYILKQLEAIDNLPEEKQKNVVALLDAFIKQQKLEELMHG
jgi:transcriptional regulator with XRE-family HTH domain